MGGAWGQNIGNAFFSVGGKHLLSKAFSGAHVDLVQDAPAYRTFNNKASGNPKNDWNILSRIQCDFFVVQGPMLDVNFPIIWRDTFKRLNQRGSRIILLSAGLFRYTQEEININKKFLKEFGSSLRNYPIFWL